MRGWMLAMAGVLAMGMSNGMVRAEHYEVFILAGQSNMDGRAKVGELTGLLATWAGPQKDVEICYSDSSRRGKALSSEGWVALQPGFSVAPGSKLEALPGKTFGPEMSFGRTVADAWKEKHIALLKFAEGGTSLHKDWGVGEKGKLYDQMMTFVGASLERMTKAGDTFEVRGFAWHQGESDSELTEGEYAGLLTELITHVRGDVAKYRGERTEVLPVVVGEVFDNHKRGTILAAQADVCVKVPGCGLASAKGLSTFDGGTHFDAPSQIELGKRIGAAMLKLMEKP
jgi:Carbohydrate esterase, sialic acid-specific acetylesterase